MFRKSRPTQVPWKCDHCGAKYMVTISGITESNAEWPPCIKCHQKMVFSSKRIAIEFEPMFESTDTT
jgi:hypothetical protein